MAYLPLLPLGIAVVGIGLRLEGSRIGTLFILVAIVLWTVQFFRTFSVLPKLNQQFLDGCSKSQKQKEDEAQT